MKLDLEKFKLIPSTYNAIDFMKIQYEDKDLVMKLKGEFFIIDVKGYGLRLVFTPDHNEIIDKIYDLAGFQNKSELNSISLSMNKTTPFFNHKNIQMDQNKCKSKRGALKIKMRGCVAVCFSSFSIMYDRLNAYAVQIKVNEFLKEEKVESMFDEED